jgi:hypothetical protein
MLRSAASRLAFLESIAAADLSNKGLAQLNDGGKGRFLCLPSFTPPDPTNSKCMERVFMVRLWHVDEVCT